MTDDRTDETLIAATLAGDYPAFEVLIERYQDKAFRLAWGFVKNDDEAKDVLQDAFLNTFRKLDTFKGDSKFSSWLYRIVVNTSLMRLRKRKRRSEVAIDNVSPDFQASGHHAAVVPNVVVSPQQAVENVELRDKILAAIDQLEPKYQTVFVLKEIEGLDLAEIARITELTVPAVKSRLHRARLFLRATLEPYLADR